MEKSNLVSFLGARLVLHCRLLLHHNMPTKNKQYNSIRTKYREQKGAYPWAGVWAIHPRKVTFTLRTIICCIIHTIIETIWLHVVNLLLRLKCY